MTVFSLIVAVLLGMWSNGVTPDDDCSCDPSSSSCVVQQGSGGGGQ
jgi:hypothetical protein